MIPLLLAREHRTQTVAKAEALKHPHRGGLPERHPSLEPLRRDPGEDMRKCWRGVACAVEIAGSLVGEVYSSAKKVLHAFTNEVSVLQDIDELHEPFARF